jgi:hypothetical protein
MSEEAVVPQVLLWACDCCAVTPCMHADESGVTLHSLPGTQHTLQIFGYLVCRHARVTWGAVESGTTMQRKTLQERCYS